MSQKKHIFCILKDNALRFLGFFFLFFYIFFITFQFYFVYGMTGVLVGFTTEMLMKQHKITYDRQ